MEYLMFRYAKASANPFLNPEYVSAMSAGGYSFPSFEEYKRRYPKTRLTSEAYYSKMGAYELAARTDPAYAWGAQLARKALQLGWITSIAYSSMKKRGFARKDGTPLAPIGKEETF
jgi:hypothetical protein